MIRALVDGTLAGAAGTLALEAVTYLDMVARGRPPSDVPEQVTAQALDTAGVSLGDGPAAAHRQSALAALGGYATGVGLGAAYGLARRGRPGPAGARRWWGTGLAVGAVAMAGANAPAVRAGVTDPRRWGLVGWLSDIVPHVAYGLVTVVAHDRLAGGGRGAHRSPVWAAGPGEPARHGR